MKGGGSQDEVSGPGPVVDTEVLPVVVEPVEAPGSIKLYPSKWHGPPFT